MVKVALWERIRTELAGEIAAGIYRAGEKLPSEAALAARFGVNRHTIRQALADLAAGGQVWARRGAGVFVAERQTDYPIGVRPRFHETVSALGKLPSREISRVETRRASAEEAAALALSEGALVHVVDGLSLIDGLPVAVVRSVFPAERLPDLPEALRETPSISAALAAGGVADFTRASTRIGAELATGPRALALRLKENAPLLRSEAINIDLSGQPVEFGIAWFAGERVTLTLAG